MIAKRNGQDHSALNDILFKEELEQKELLNNRVSFSQNTGLRSFGQLFADKDLLKNLLACFVIWSSIKFNFYLILFKLKTFPGSIYQNSVSFAIADLLAYFSSGLILGKISSNRTLRLAFVVSIGGCLVYESLLRIDSLTFIFIMIWRFGNSIGFNTVYNCHNRYFPVEMLTSTFGLVNLVSHLYSISAPLAAELQEPYAMLIFLINCVAALVATFYVKELFNKPTQ